MKTYFDDLAKALEMRHKAEEESQKYYLMYERLLLQSQIAMKMAAKSTTQKSNKSEDKSDNGFGQLSDLQLMLHSTISNPTPNKITQIPSELEIDDESEKPPSAVALSVIKKKSSSGLLLFALPKIKKTIRVRKNPKYFYSYSLDDVRYCVNECTQFNDTDKQDIIDGSQNINVLAESNVQIQPEKDKENENEIENNEGSDESLKKSNNNSFVSNRKSNIQLLLTESKGIIGTGKPISSNLNKETDFFKGSCNNLNNLNLSKEKEDSNEKSKLSDQKSNPKLCDLDYLKFKITKLEEELASTKLKMAELQDKSISNNNTEYINDSVDKISKKGIENSKERQIDDDEDYDTDDLNKSKSKNIIDSPEICCDLIRKIDEDDLDGNKTDNENVDDDGEITELQRTNTKIFRYKPSQKQATVAKNKNKRNKIQTSEAAFIVSSFLKTFSKNKKNIFKYRMPNRNMLKIISALYQQLLGSYKEMRLSKLFQLKKSMKDLLFTFLLNKFGNQEFASKKMKLFINSLAVNQNMPRAHLMMGFIGLARDMEEDDANLYINTTGYMYNMKSGVLTKNSDIDESHYIPFTRASEVVKHLFMEQTKESLTEFYLKLERLKLPDPKKMNPFIIDIDKFMILLLEQYHIVLGKVRDFIDDMFKASDLDQSKTLEFFEFNILFKLIEPNIYSYGRCKSLFTHASEEVCEDGKITPVITFNHFVNVCEAEKLFSMESQDVFLRYNKTDDHIKLVKILKSNFELLTHDITTRIKGLVDQSSYLKTVLEVLKNSSTKDNAREAKSCWMMYRIVEDMSMHLYSDDECDNYMGELNGMVTLESEPNLKQLLLWKEIGYNKYLNK